MSTLSDLVSARTELDAADIDWLQLLVAEWQLLADLSFADLLLYVRLRDDDAFLTVAQMRPTTGPTGYLDDRVGSVVPATERAILERAWQEGRICRDDESRWASGDVVREEAVPVRRGRRVLAVVALSTNLAAARVPSPLELAYLASAADLAMMISQGRFPFPGASADLTAGARVGDGLLRLDAVGRVTYASPNALSAYRRLGSSGNLVGSRLDRLTAALSAGGRVLDDPGVAGVLSSGVPSESEIESAGTVVLRRAIPLLPGGQVLGALVLVRDVTELRRRDRALVSKDATIREIHHRVKNNLQTVAALLRLQARRLSAPEGRAALEESVRRVASIALVHETLSLTLEETVEFDTIADRVSAMVAEMTAPGTPVVMRRTGSFGVLPAEVATPLAMVLTELLQNAVEHAFADRGGTLEVLSSRGERGPDGTRLDVVVVDDGAGLAPDFSLEDSSRLGLQIVRTLVVGELGGALSLAARPEGGTSVHVHIPLSG
ncbi:MAG: PAS domain-containing sensor histidine kinase [Actinomycetota bacterium]|nr:PAS domain-containing sensor histidine kinase [Actinomycetota bacterium]